MRAAPWAADVVVGEGLADHGFAARGGVVAAVNMARQEEANPYGVPGRRWVAAEGGKPVPDRQRPAWRLGTGRDATLPDGQRRRRSAGIVRQPTSLADIAPTIVDFLGLSTEGFDGSPLPLR